MKTKHTNLQKKETKTKKIIVALIGLSMIAGSLALIKALMTSPTVAPATKAETLAAVKMHPSAYTVMITNLQGTGGGSGVIIKNSPSESTVLTNGHVCKGALMKGGKIIQVNGSEHLVVSFSLGKDHDICSIRVASDLGHSVEIASKASALYSEATVTGHPALMPNIITKGHFGGHRIIPIMVGARPCEEEDNKNPETALFCAVFGIAPVIRHYESQVVSATIMAGSSGSPVLNDKGELSNLVFAGNAEGLSYGFTVPYESVKNYLDKELNDTSAELRPWISESDAKAVAEEAVTMSQSEVKDFFNKICKRSGILDERADAICQRLENVY